MTTYPKTLNNKVEGEIIFDLLDEEKFFDKKIY